MYGRIRLAAAPLRQNHSGVGSHCMSSGLGQSGDANDVCGVLLLFSRRTRTTTEEEGGSQFQLASAGPEE